MKKVNILKIIGLSLVIFSANAQDYSADAFRFSQLINPAGTARMKALGGEHSAIGADVSNISGNPAGLGLYTRSEFSVSAGLNSLNTNTNYIDTQTQLTKGNFGLNNIALVFGGNSGNNGKVNSYRSGWKSGNFGISYNRNSNLFNNFSFGGLNNRSSLADSYVEQVNRNNNNTGAFLDSQDQFNPDTRVAQSAEAMYYQMYLIEPAANGGVPYKRFDFNNPTSTRQEGTFQSEGKTSQWTFGYGANYNDKLYIGVSGGIANLNYDFMNTQTDEFVGGRYLNDFTATQLLTVQGKGVNLSTGLIFRPNNLVRIGATIHSPTWYSITESYDQNISVNVNQSNTAGIPKDLRSASVAPYDFDYELRSPLRGSVGMAVFIGKKGFISADAEYVGYNKMKLTATTLSPSDNTAFTNDNSRYINQDYKNVVNLKVGAEMRAGNVNLRGGIAYLADPYKVKYDNIDRARLAFSGGLGYKSNSFYLDLTGSYSAYKSAFTPYSLNNPADYASAKIDTKNTNLSFTFGTYF
ncbi:MAG: hypothetical protein V4683_07555 [Bacteroidota bacterium]